MREAKKNIRFIAALLKVRERLTTLLPVCCSFAGSSYVYGFYGIIHGATWSLGIVRRGIFYGSIWPKGPGNRSVSQLRQVKHEEQKEETEIWVDSLPNKLRTAQVDPGARLQIWVRRIVGRLVCPTMTWVRSLPSLPAQKMLHLAIKLTNCCRDFRRCLR